MNGVDSIFHGGNGSLAVRDGVVVDFGPDVAAAAREEIDLGGASILPGWIDAHVHFNEPGRADWEGIETGSRALAAGGGTVFFDMPLNSHPPVITRAAFEEKRRIGEAESCVDFALWGGLTPDSLDEMEAMAAAGAIGFKAFMCPSGIDEFGAANPSTLRRGMEISAKLGLPVAVHAEDPEVIRQHQLAHPPAGTDMRAWLDSRPIEAELSAIRIALDLAGETGCALHIVHVTCAAGIRLVSEARGRGVDVTVETCPHYLLLDDEDAIHIGPAAKCAPPIRESVELFALWKQFLSGEIDTIGSDHSPSPPDLKRGDDIFAMWGGIAGVQHGMLLVQNKLHASRYQNLLAELSAKVAARFKLAAKGSLEPGKDADFIVVRESPHVIAREELLTRHAISPYVGMATGIVIGETYQRGRRVTGETRGRFLAPG